MIAVVLRLVLLLLPLVAVVMWLRWRVDTERDEAELQEEFRRLRKTLAILAGLMLLAVLGLWLTDDRGGDARTRYVPPHSENGKVVPGHFEPIEADKTRKDQPEKQPDGGDGS